jgi:hypothetical protein
MIGRDFNGPPMAFHRRPALSHAGKNQADIEMGYGFLIPPHIDAVQRLSMRRQGFGVLTGIPKKFSQIMGRAG